MRRFFTFIFLLLVVAAAVLAYTLLTPEPISGSKAVLLRPGWGVRRIAVELKNAGVIRSSNAFLLLHATRMKPLKAGEYLFDHPQTAVDVYNRLERGDIYFHTVIIPEGQTMFDIAATVEGAGLGPRADFLAAARGDTALIKDVDPAAQSLEGYLFPDTYRFTP